MILALLLAGWLWPAPAWSHEPASEPEPAAPAGETGCPGADPTDLQADDDALQACLDRGGTIALRAGSPGYRIARGLRLTQPGTTLTSADAPEKARLQAEPDLFAPLLAMPDDARGWTLSHLVFDGNLPQRTRYRECSGYRPYGTNVLARGSDFLVDSIESVGAMCGTSFELVGRRFEVTRSFFGHNGRPLERAVGVRDPWADGLTLLRCDEGWVHDNRFLDNTDIGLVSGGGSGCRVESNLIEQRDVFAFAGLHVWNFAAGDGGRGEHTGSVYRNNRIVSSRDSMGIGLMVGTHPWDMHLVVKDAGTVADNEIEGAVVNLAVDGIERGRVWGNRMSGAQGHRGPGVCPLSAEYTAGDYGEALLQDGAIGRVYHNGICLPVFRRGENNARFMSQSVPTRLRPGEPTQAEITLLNTGSSVWSPELGFLLGAQSPRDNRTFRDGRVPLEARVPAGKAYTFRFPFAAPRQPGVYTFQWRMLREHVEWFGDRTPPVRIVVAPPSRTQASVRP